MTKDEIKKALHHCVSGTACKSCLLYDKGSSCVGELTELAYNLITEQEEEIEELKK